MDGSGQQSWEAPAAEGVLRASHQGVSSLFLLMEAKLQRELNDQFKATGRSSRAVESNPGFPTQISVVISDPLQKQIFCSPTSGKVLVGKSKFSDAISGFQFLFRAHYLSCSLFVVHVWKTHVLTSALCKSIPHINEQLCLIFRFIHLRCRSSKRRKTMQGTIAVKCLTRTNLIAALLTLKSLVRFHLYL